jgi:Glyoxalase/Bleomycin resistance protein/Dioxygenase superfamily
MLLENHYQNAYITKDLDAAMELFRTQYDFNGFKHFQVSYELRTPMGSGTATVRLALGWVGELQYELIQPISGFTDIYREGLPEQYPLKFHHAAMRIHDWDAFRARIDREKLPVAIEGGTPGQLHFLYIDARETVGHYLEYCWMTPERWAQIRAL